MTRRDWIFALLGAFAVWAFEHPDTVGRLADQFDIWWSYFVGAGLWLALIWYLVGKARSTIGWLARRRAGGSQP